MRSPHKNRAAFAVRKLLIALAVTAVVLATAWFLFPRFSWSSSEAGPLMHRVERSDFMHEISEQGEVESASNVEIRSEVRSKGSGGITILEIVPEGTNVKSGDVLVKLDSSSLENERTQEQITCNTSEASLIQAQNTYETALIAKREYLEGKYRQEVQTIQNEIIVAKENRDRAKDYHVYSKRLAAKGYVTMLQLDADQFAVQKAENELEAAQTKLEVLEKFTKEKQIKQLEADIKTAEAKLKAQEASHTLDLEKLTLTESQIEKCIIKAPEAGQVVYANIVGRRGSNETIIEEGATVRERQVLIRLPDPKRMQITAKVNESKVSLVAVAMPVVVRLDAFADMALVGRVEKVGEYPAPTSWFNSSVKEYETIVNILDPPSDLRPGLTAEVRIRVEFIPNVLQVPVQAVFQHGDRYYCVLRDGQGYKSQEVKIGSTNDKFVVISEGLKEGDEVVMGAATYRDKVDLPELPPESKGKKAAPKTPDAADQRQASPKAGKKPTGGAPPQGAGPQGADPAAMADSLFQRLDKNSSGKLEKDELPDQMKSRLGTIDSNGDGAVDRGELKASMAKMRASRPGGDRAPGAGP